MNILPKLLHLLTSFATVVLLLSTLCPANAETPDEQLEFASGLYQQKLYSLAAAKLSEFIKANPTHPKETLASYQLAAALYRATGETGEPDYAAVAAAYEKALAKPAPTPQIAAAALIEIGDAYYNLQKYDQAIKSLTAYLGSTPAPEKENAAWAQYWIAQSFYELKKPAEARAAYQKVVAQYGENEEVAPYAQHALGVLSAEAGDAKAAAIAFQGVLTRYPESEIALDARLQLAHAHLNGKNYEQAQTAYRALIDDPKAAALKTDALIGLADAYFRNKDFESAATHYQQTLAALPTDAKSRPTVQLQLAHSYYNSKKYDEAVKAYAPLLQSGDANIAAAAHYYSAGSQSALKKFNEAATLYSKVVETYPQHELASKAALRLGDALADGGDNTRANSAYQAVVAKYAQSQEAKEARTAIAALAGEAAAGQLAEVQSAFDAKDWAKTAQIAQALVDKKATPQIAEAALYLWADAKRQAGDATAAAQLFRRQTIDYPKGSLVNEARLGLTWSLLDAKQWDEAAKSAREAATAVPDEEKTRDLQDRIQLALGEALLRGSNAPHAAIAFSRVENSSNKELASQAVYGAALALEGAKQWPEAATKWSRYAEVSTDATAKARAYLRQGLASREAKNGAEALAAFDRALAADAKGEVGAEALYESAWQAHDLKKPDDEAARWKRLASDFPDSKFANEAAFQQAEVLYDAKSYAEAARVYRSVLDKAPQSEIAPLAAYKLGSSLYYEKNWAEAAAAFDKATAAKGFSSEASFWAGESWRQAGKLSEARTRYKTFLQNLNTTGSTPAAAIALKEMLPRAKLGLGLALAENNEWTRAVNAYTEGLKDAEGDIAAQLHYHLGAALAKQEKWKEASTQFLKVSISYPESEWAAKAQWNAGQALEKSGESGAALAVYKLLAARQPESDVVKQAQERVQAMEAAGS